MNRIRHRTVELIIATVIIATIALMGGCGQTGELRLPDEKHETHPESHKTEHEDRDTE